MELVLVFNDDGICTFIVDGKEDLTATWSVEGNMITLDNGVESLALTVDGNQMITEQDGVRMVFEAETDAASTDAGETDAASTDAGETDAAST
ncbi:MAG: hypothetical protein MJ136_04830, partial [Clostridia bacterium]|nr:hypothetical protein [Clostridia bacterium]